MSRSQRIKQQQRKALAKLPKLSRPTMCLHCHMIVALVRNDELKRWDCPQCQHVYPDKSWLIKAARPPRK